MLLHLFINLKKVIQLFKTKHTIIKNDSFPVPKKGTNENYYKDRLNLNKIKVFKNFGVLNR